MDKEGIEGGFFKRNGYSFDERRNLFWFACLPVRFIVTVSVFRFREHGYTSLFLLIGGILSLLSQLSARKKGGNVWWNRDFHLAIISLVILLSGGGVLTWALDDSESHKRKVKAINTTLGSLLFLDFTFGIGTRLAKF